MSKVSIIIANRNNASVLPRCLDSVINQTLNDIEVICLDDASEDDSVRVIKDYQKTDDRIRLITFQENKGLLYLRKHGILNTNAEYFMFLDSDDWLETVACEELYQEAAKSNVDIVVFNTIPEKVSSLITDKKLKQTIERINHLPKGFYDQEESMDYFVGKDPRGWSWNKIYKRKTVIKDIAVIPDVFFNLFEDIVLSYFLLKNITMLSKIEKYYHHYSIGMGLSTSNSVCEQQINFIKNHLPGYTFLKNADPAIYGEKYKKLAYSYVITSIYIHLKQLPKEMYKFCGKEIIEIIKSKEFYSLVEQNQGKKKKQVSLFNIPLFCKEKSPITKEYRLFNIPIYKRVKFLDSKSIYILNTLIYKKMYQID